MPLSKLYEKPRNGSKVRSFPVKVSTMDAEMKFDDIELKATGKDLFELTCRTLGLRETWYFGLQYVSRKGDVRWLRHEKKILDQDMPAENPRSFTLLVKFFPEDVSEIIQEITQHLFFLQVTQSILNGDIYCPPEATVLLASYAVQAKYGDYDEALYQPEMLATEDLLPQRVIDQYQMTPDMWAEKIKVWYANTNIQGMQSDEAELEYLKIAQDLEMYGIGYFQIRNKRSVDLWLGVSALGLFVYDQDDRLTPKVSFRWNEIKNISYNDKKFVIKMIDKKSLDFIFIAPKLKINKMILELCVGNHAMYMKRRKPDSMEVQQMKIQAREEKARKQMEREQLHREKQLREEAQKEKEEIQQRMHELQDQFHTAQEAMVRSEEAADLLAEKVRVAEEESDLLMRKASEAEVDKQRIQLAAIKTEEEKLLSEKRARKAEIIASRIVDECERRVHEASQLRAELTLARMAEKAARDKYQDFMRTSTMYGNFVVAPPTSDVGDVRSTAASVVTAEYQLPSSELPDYVQTDQAELGNVLPAADMDTLSRAIEKERVEYLEKSKHLQEQLKELRSEIEVLKVEEKQSHMDEIHDQNVLHGNGKYTTIGRSRTSSAKARIQFYEEL